MQTEKKAEQIRRPWIRGGLFFTVFIVAVVILFFSVHREAVRSLLCTLWESDGNSFGVLNDYVDILIAVIAAVVTALLSISITMYVFLKSALDRVIDDNQYIANVATIYLKETSRLLTLTALANILPLFVSLAWHFLLEFQSFLSAHDHKLLLIGAGTLCALFLLDIWITCSFWIQCINLRGNLKKIIERERKRATAEMEAFLKRRHSCVESALDDAWLLIGYWSNWETDTLDAILARNGGRLTWDAGNPVMKDVMEYGKKQCGEMDEDQFINLFSRTEKLLLSGAEGKIRSKYDESTMVNIIQERENVSDSTIDVEKKDMDQKKYPGSSGRGGDAEILDYINSFREAVGYAGEDRTNEFFHDTKDLYKILRGYRDLILSGHNAPREQASGNKSCKKKRRDESGTDQELYIKTGMYLFFLRVAAMFVSAVRITDFTFNGNTLSFADFYNSTLSNVSFYNAAFFHTIFARTKMQRAVLDLSKIDTVFFYYTQLTGTSLNNSIFTDVIFEDMQAQESDLSICIFCRCTFKNSMVVDSVLNKSSFENSRLESSDFSGSRLHDITWKDTELTDCVFRNAALRNWKWENGSSGGVCLKNCDFSGSTWEEMRLCNANLENSVFTKASLVEAKFHGANLNHTLFRQCQLAGATFKACHSFTQSSFWEANLFDAEFLDCEMEQVNLYRASASHSAFERCCLKNSDCAEVYFRNAKLDTVDFEAARLYSTTFNWAKITNCSFKYAVADRLQFTFAECMNVVFDFSTMTESTLSGSNFRCCSFHGTDLSESTAAEPTFTQCSMSHASFAGTRLVKATFEQGNITNCVFSKCEFEEGVYRDLHFTNCSFADASFSCAEFQNVTFTNCDFDGLMFLNCNYQNVVFDQCIAGKEESRNVLMRGQLSRYHMEPARDDVTIKEGVLHIP